MPELWNGEPIPYHEPIEVLLAAISSPGPKAWAAIRALVERPGPEMLAILIGLTRSRDPHLRRAAVEAIGNHRSGQDGAVAVVDMLHDHDGIVVRAACIAATALGLSVAHDRVRELIDSEEEATRYTAWDALETLWEPTDFEGVFARYQHDPSDRTIRRRAAWTLAKHVGREHWERVFAAWSRDNVSRHRVWACTLAETFGDRAIFPALNPLRADPDGHVRRAADRAVIMISAS
ncbi:HEAT repeat domain-containing protein [Singulisphaera rosea]